MRKFSSGTLRHICSPPTLTSGRRAAIQHVAALFVSVAVVLAPAGCGYEHNPAGRDAVDAEGPTSSTGTSTASVSAGTSQQPSNPLPAQGIEVFKAAWGTGPDQVGEPGNHTTGGILEGPASFVVANDGSIYLLDANNSRVLLISPAGEVTKAIPIETREPTDIALAADGSVIVDDSLGTATIQAYSTNGGLKAKLKLPANAQGVILWTQGDVTYSFMALDMDKGPGRGGYVPIYQGGAFQDPAQTMAQGSSDKPLPGGSVNLSTRGSTVVATINNTGKSPVLVSLDPDLSSSVETDRLPSGETTLSFLVEVKDASGALTGVSHRILWVVDRAGGIKKFDLGIERFRGDGTVATRVGPDGMIYYLNGDPAGGIRIDRFALD
ncbi:MAG: hypothetical protein Kow00122_04370 [Thermoleophilia bacterium]